MAKNFLFLFFIIFVFTSCSKQVDEIENASGGFPVLAYDSELLETLTLDKSNIYIDKPRELLYWTQHFQNPKNNLNHINSNNNFDERKKILSGGKGPINILQPIYFNKNICVVLNNGFLECRNVESGQLIFKIDLKPEDIQKYEVIRGGIAYLDSQIISVDAYGQVLSIDTTNGSISWSVNIGFPILSPPLIYRDFVYFISSDNRIFCISLKSGEIEWSFQTISETRKNLFTASPVAYENIVIAPFSNGELVAFLYDTGRPIWSESLSKITMVSNFDIKDISASPVIYKNNIYALSSNGKLASVNVINGKRNWSKNISGYRTPIVTGNQVYVLNNEGKLICVDINSGEIYWITDLGKYKKGKKVKDLNLWLGPYLINDKLYALSFFGELKTISPYSGEILEERNLATKNILVPPIIVSDGIFIVDENSNVYRY